MRLKHSQMTGVGRFGAGVGIALLVAILGCASARKKKDVPLPPHLASPGAIDCAAPPGGYPEGEKAVIAALGGQCGPLALPAPPAAIQPKPLNVLALSGGGQYGAYAAGVLVGWTASGTRPDFDVCTGISSGALIAGLAFLGPKYDAMLQQSFTNLERRDLVRYQPVRALIKYQSLGTSRPLRKHIEEIITDEMVEDLRCAHLSGRRLFIGTMNLRTRRLTVWDIGAIACSGRPDTRELIVKLFLASSSISGMVPAVPFEVEVDGVPYVEKHVDGGAVSQVFVRFGENHPRPIPGCGPGGRWLTGSHLYLIAGGKLYADPLPPDPGFLPSMSGTVSASLYALYRAELLRLYALCGVSGMKFHLTAIPADLETAKGSVQFEPEAQKKMFEVGYRIGIANGPWRDTPPGWLPGEDEIPRAGLKFSVPCPGTSPGTLPPEGFPSSPQPPIHGNPPTQMPTQPTQPAKPPVSTLPPVTPTPSGNQPLLPRPPMPRPQVPMPLPIPIPTVK